MTGVGLLTVGVDCEAPLIASQWQSVAVGIITCFFSPKLGSTPPNPSTNLKYANSVNSAFAPRRPSPIAAAGAVFTFLYFWPPQIWPNSNFFLFFYIIISREPHALDDTLV